ncbi:gp53-like domain-containing protein [Klebsiella pneumoniae]|uniref:gp53-like domain-containing protein n=2 Tax=Escherichia coli TaxID=562 RepID=UPI00198F61D5|nr:tail fiber protein [Escherichia coli]CAD6171027.1 tail fiber protein [Escherichia coli]
MHRIDTKTAQKDKFGAGKNGFTRGNPQTGTPATDLDDDYFDMLQEELCGVVEASGASLEKGRNDQLLTALHALLLSRKNPFGDIKSDGTVKTALENLGFGERLLEADGYFELPGGLLLQWGHGSIHASSAIIQFKKSFNVTPFIVLPHKITTDGRYVTSSNYTLTSFSLYGWNGNGTVNNIDSYTYFALGM